MAAPDNRILCVVLTSLVLVFAGGCHGRLLLTMDLKADANFCGHLNCWNAGTSEKVILAITSISLYDISQPAVRIQLATVKNDGTGIKINQSKTSEVVGAGCINRYDADLSVNLMNQQDCQSGSFLCELEYIDTDGRSDTMIAHSTSVNSSGQCDCGELTSQLKTLTQNYTVEVAGLKQQYSRLMSQFQNMSEELALIRKPTSRPQEKTSNSRSRKNQTSTTEQVLEFPTSLTNECRKGMEYYSSRVKFLLWGRIPALCDTETDGGGWVIIQRRAKGDVDFYRNWESYKNGFGTPDTDYWLGNDVIHNLTSQGYNELRVDMGLHAEPYYAQYKVFTVENETKNYKLFTDRYRGNAGSSLTYSNNRMFSTFDRHNDFDNYNLAAHYHGGWWYNDNQNANINGAWKTNDYTGMTWPDISDSLFLTFTEVKVRY